jgi:nitrile hydratase accessory protein
VTPEPVFAAPWEAEAFALVLALHEAGAFSWAEWSAALAEEVGDRPYYESWLAALERLVAAKGLTDAATLSRYAAAWGRAAERTPHGTPIELHPDDLRPRREDGAQGLRAG